MSALVSEVTRTSKDPDLRSKFVNVTFLLGLAILLNQDYGAHKSMKTSEVRDKDRHPLEALAEILAQHDEVISTCHIAETTTVLIAYQSPTKIPGTDLDACLDETVDIHHRLRIAPHFDENQQEKSAQTNSNLHHLRTIDLEDAVNLWPLIQKNRWHCAFQ